MALQVVQETSLNGSNSETSSTVLHPGHTVWEIRSVSITGVLFGSVMTIRRAMIARAYVSAFYLETVYCL